MIVEANWGNFRAKFNGREQKAFEWLCSLLFYKEHGHPTGALRYFNQPGIEAEPVIVGADVIGFQAKFIDTGLSSYTAKLTGAIDSAKAQHPKLTQLYFYVNVDFGMSKKPGVKDPPYKTEIEEHDFFSRFVFEYLAFVALLQNKLFIGAGSDRKTIQALKRDRAREEVYVAAIGEYEPLRRLWQNVMAELGRAPLHNSSRDLDNPEIDVWWNNTSFEPKKDDKSPQGVVRSLSDWANMVEFWHSVRNNLFHGGKDPTIRRDCFLVEHVSNPGVIYGK